MTVTGARNHNKLFATVEIGIEAAVEDIFFTAHLFSINFPALAVRRITQHKIKLPCGVAVNRKCRTVSYMLGLVAVALEQHIRLTDGVGFRLELLPEQMNRNLFTSSSSQRHQSVLCDCEHTAGAAGSIVTGVGRVHDFVRNRHKYEVGHQLHNVAGRPVFTGFLVILFVELAD